MTRKRPWRAAGIVLAALVVAACNNNNNVLSNYTPPGAPSGLVYQLNLGEQIGSGDSVIDAGVLLSWLPPSPDSTIQAFIVYGDSTGAPDTSNFQQRAVTTSLSFHDVFTEAQYTVTSQDVNGVQSARSNIVVIDASDTVQTPSNLTGTPLDSAAELAWPDNSITGPNGSRFDFYRVYSDSVNGSTCVSASTVLEGQTVSNGFVITGIANGVPRCYFVTAVTRSGHESAGSPAVILTPSSTDPPYSAARIPGNFMIVTHHPISLRHTVLARH